MCLVICFAQLIFPTFWNHIFQSSTKTQNYLIQSQRYSQVEKRYAEGKGMMTEPQKKYFKLTYGLKKARLMFFSWNCVENVQKHNTWKKCLFNFVKAAVDAGRQRDENPKSSVVAETRKLLANNYDYRSIDRSQHTLTKYLKNGEAHSATKPSPNGKIMVWEFL